MAFYRTGTVTVTSGSPIVTAAGANFIAAGVEHQDVFVHASGWPAEILTVDSPTQLTLASNWPGSTASGAGYMIMPINAFARIAELNAGVAELLAEFGDIRDGAVAGLFGAGNAAAPGIRFAEDQDTGFFRAASNQAGVSAGGATRALFDGTNGLWAYGVGAAAALAIALSLGKTAAGTPGHFVLTSDGALTVGDLRFRQARWTGTMTFEHESSTGPRPAVGISLSETDHYISAFDQAGAEKSRLSGTGASFVTGGFFGVNTTAPEGRLHVTANVAAPNACQMVIGYGGTSVNYFDANANVFRDGSATEVARLSGGNLLVGVSSGSSHVLARGSAEDDLILNVSGLAQGSARFFSALTQTYNAAAAAMKVNANGTTGRSINVPGTINAGGTDYAEYMIKADGCGTIEPGDVCGVDREGLLTRAWADAISCVVKSTNPSYVGGDDWAAEVGPRPEQEEEEAEEAFADRLSAWEALLEAARQKVDRIAFSGQVPVNVDEVTLAACEAALAAGEGIYLVAAANGGGIKAIAVPEADMTLPLYMKRLGKVWAIRDGRPWIDVQHG